MARKQHIKENYSIYFSTLERRSILMKFRIVLLIIACLLTLSTTSISLTYYECQFWYENCVNSCWWWDQECYWECRAYKEGCITGQDCFYDREGNIWCLDRQ